MPSKSKVYLAGVGYSQQSGNSGVKLSLVSAATKALIDAGITYDDVTIGVRSKKLSQGAEAFQAFDEDGIKVDEVEDGSELEAAFNLVSDKGNKCVLTIAAEKSATVAFVLISEDFLWRHPYLKDSAAAISKSKSSGSDSEGLHGLCQIAWTLRGWSQSKGEGDAKKQLSYKGFELSRVAQDTIPKWKDVEHKQDGKFRFRYNPATETRDIFQEDFEAVRAGGTKRRDSNHFKRKGGDRAALAKL